MNKIYPLSLRIAIFFKNMNISDIYKIAKIMDKETYKELKNNDVFKLNNLMLFPESPIMRLETIEQTKQRFFTIQNNLRADYIFYSLHDSIESSQKEIDFIFDTIIEKLYDFFDECNFSINRIGIGETFASEQISEIKTLCKKDTTTRFNINEIYRINFEKINVYDNIRVFNNLMNNNKIPQILRSKKLFYIQRDINSELVQGQYIDKSFVKNFKDGVKKLFKEDEIRQIYKRVLNE